MNIYISVGDPEKNKYDGKWRNKQNLFPQPFQEAG